jgi:hypothetical protein
MTIKHATYIEERLPINSPVPTQSEIRKQFAGLFGDMAKPLATVINPCAEVTERMIIQVLNKFRETEELPVVVKRKSNQNYDKHYCSNCKHISIHSSHNYCPKCGSKINWI